MTELILKLIASVLCLIGLTEVIYKVKLKIFSPEIHLLRGRKSLSAIF